MCQESSAVNTCAGHNRMLQSKQRKGYLIFILPPFLYSIVSDLFFHVSHSWVWPVYTTATSTLHSSLLLVDYMHVL